MVKSDSISWRLIVFVGIVFSLFSCIEDVAQNLDGDQSNRLLNNGFGKEWFLQSKTINGRDIPLEECVDAVKLVFIENGDADSLYMVNKMSFCNADQDPDTLLLADYSVVTNNDGDFEFQLALSNIAGYDTEIINVSQLTSLNLSINYTVNGDEVEDLYTYNSERFLSKVDANYLLSNFGIKKWYRNSRSEDSTDIKLDSCVGDLNLVFDNSDTDRLYFIEQVARCEEGVWPNNVFTSFYDLSVNENDDFTGLILLEDANGNSVGEMSISNLTSEDLSLNYIRNGVEIIETYTEVTE
ncbi:MAG: hypothetical protein OCD76_01920 [Reichenbachiella sp.]